MTERPEGWLQNPLTVQLMATASAIVVAAFVIWLNRWLDRRDERERVTIQLVHSLRQLRAKARLSRQAAAHLGKEKDETLLDTVAQHPERECAELSALWPKANLFKSDTLAAIETAKAMADVWTDHVGKFGIRPHRVEEIRLATRLYREVIEACDAALKALGHREQDDEAADNSVPRAGGDEPSPPTSRRQGWGRGRRR